MFRKLFERPLNYGYTDSIPIFYSTTLSIWVINVRKYCEPISTSPLWSIHHSSYFYQRQRFIMRSVIMLSGILSELPRVILNLIVALFTYDYTPKGKSRLINVLISVNLNVSKISLEWELAWEVFTLIGDILNSLYHTVLCYIHKVCRQSTRMNEPIQVVYYHRLVTGLVYIVPSFCELR